VAFNKGDIVKLETPVGGTYVKWGTHPFPESSVPEDFYVILNKTKNKVRMAVQLEKSCRPRPSSKHIYEISKRNFKMLKKHCP